MQIVYSYSIILRHRNEIMPISNPFEKARCAAIMLFMLPRYGRSAIIYPRSLQNRFQVTTIAARVL